MIQKIILFFSWLLILNENILKKKHDYYVNESDSAYKI